MLNISRKFIEKIKIHNLFLVTPPLPENRAVYENVEKCSRTGQATDGNINCACALHAG